MQVLGLSETLAIYNCADYVVKRHLRKLHDTQQPPHVEPQLDVLLSRGRLRFTVDTGIFPFDHFIPVDVPALPGNPTVIRLFPNHGPVRVVQFNAAGITIEVSGPWSGEWLLFGEPL